MKLTTLITASLAATAMALPAATRREVPDDNKPDRSGSDKSDDPNNCRPFPTIFDCPEGCSMWDCISGGHEPWVPWGLDERGALSRSESDPGRSGSDKPYNDKCVAVAGYCPDGCSQWQCDAAAPAKRA